MKKFLSLILLSFLATAPLFAIEDGDTTLFERGYETAWTEDDAVTWSTPSADANVLTEVIPDYGLHSGYIDQQTYYRIAVLASDTVTARDPSAGIINVDAQWIAYGELGRVFPINYSFFRVGSIYITHCAQQADNEFSYSTDGMATYTEFGSSTSAEFSGLTGKSNPWGGRVTTIATIPFMNIQMQLDMPHNKLVYLRISNANDPNTILFEVKNIDIVGMDWSQIVLESGFHKEQSISGSPNMFLKKLRLVETDQTQEKASYRITYKYIETNERVNDNSIVYSGFKGETIELPTSMWFYDPDNPDSDDKVKFYAVNPEEASHITLDLGVKEGRNNYTFYVRKAEIYKYTVTAPGLDNLVLACDSSIEGEAIPTLRWNKYVKHGDTWWVSDRPYSWTPDTEGDAEFTRSFTQSDISYFWDTSDMLVHLSHSGQGDISLEGSNYSGGYTKRHYNKDPSWYAQEIIPDGGVYEVQIPWNNTHSTDSYIELDTYQDSIPDNDSIFTVGEIADEWYYDYIAGLTAYGKNNTEGYATSGTQVIEGFKVPLNSGLILRYTNDYNSNAYLDYVTFKWIDYLRSDVAMEVTKVGQKKPIEVNLRSFICDKNYIFSECDGITAYRLKRIYTQNEKIFAEFDPIIGPTPIGTLCVLSGEPGEIYSVPYVNHSVALPADNVVVTGGAEWVQKLQISAKNDPLGSDDYEYFCLIQTSDVDETTGYNIIRFCKIDLTKSGKTIPTSAVYFKIPLSFFDENNLSKSKPFTCKFNDMELETSFDDDDYSEANGIIDLAASKVAADRYTYNLNGQRVSVGTKGFVIRNGQKFFNK